MKTTVKPPQVSDGFWVKYSAHPTSIKLTLFELEEIERMVFMFGERLDSYVSWINGKTDKSRMALLDAYRNDCIVGRYRGALLHEALTEVIKPIELSN